MARLIFLCTDTCGAPQVKTNRAAIYCIGKSGKLHGAGAPYRSQASYRRRGRSVQRSSPLRLSSLSVNHPDGFELTVTGLADPDKTLIAVDGDQAFDGGAGQFLAVDKPAIFIRRKVNAW